MNLSIVVPIYNEEDGLPELFRRLSDALHPMKLDYEMIFVNDGSADNSLVTLRQLANDHPEVKYINLSRNFGHQIAVTAGLDATQGNAVIIIDGDLQDPPELIPALYAKHQQGFEVVYAKRKSRKGETLFKKWSAKAFYRLLQRMTSIEIPLDTGDFRLIDRKVVDALKRMPEQTKFLRGQIAWVGFRQTAVEFERAERKHGETGYSLSKMIHFALDGITGFSDKPLSFVTKLGFVFSGVSFLIILYAIFAHFVMKETITGWTSLIISSMFIGGIQLISLGIIGTYISRINRNILNRPLYIIAESNLENRAE